MSIENTLNERGARYGDFTDHARICQALKRIMMIQMGWSRLSNVQKQALDVIADKIARILSGDPDYADNWHDIQGYAKLAEDRLPKAKDDMQQGKAEMGRAIGGETVNGSTKASAVNQIKPPGTNPAAAAQEKEQCDCAICMFQRAVEAELTKVLGTQVEIVRLTPEELQAQIEAANKPKH